MDYAKIENGQIKEIASLNVLFPTTSFSELGPDAEFLERHSIMPVVTSTAVDVTQERIEWVEPYVQDGRVFTFRLVPLTDEEKAALLVVANVDMANTVVANVVAISQ